MDASPILMNPTISAPREGEKSFKCSTCKRVFNKKANLKVHSRKHTGEKPYECSRPGCGRSFMWKSSVTFHEQNCQASSNSDNASSLSSSHPFGGKGVQKRPKSNKNNSPSVVASSLAASLNISPPTKHNSKSNNMGGNSVGRKKRATSAAKMAKMFETAAVAAFDDDISMLKLPAPPVDVVTATPNFSNCSNNVINTNNIVQGVWSIGSSFNLHSAPSSSSTGSPSSLLSPPPPLSSSASLLAGGYGDVAQLPAPCTLEKRASRPPVIPKQFYSSQQQQNQKESTSTTTNPSPIPISTTTTLTNPAFTSSNNNSASSSSSPTNNSSNSRPLSGGKPPVMHTGKMPKMPITMDLDDSDDEGAMKITGAQDTFLRTGYPFGGFAPKSSPLPICSPIVCGISPMPLSPLAPFSPLPPDSPAHNAPNPVHPPVNQSFTRSNNNSSPNINSNW